MSKKDSEFQKVFMSFLFRGKEIFKPLNTGWIDERVGVVREWVANVFFYRKNGATIMIDAGYHYDRLQEKMAWLDIRPSDIHDILLTHLDTDHIGAVEEGSEPLFPEARLYIGEEENKYLTGERHRRVFFRLCKLPAPKLTHPKTLLQDRQVFYIQDIKIEALLVPGHTYGHLVYLIDDAYLFTGDTIWFGADGGYSFLNSLAEDNDLARRSLANLEQLLLERGISPLVVSGHTGWTDNLSFAFRHKDRLCISGKKQEVHDPTAPYDGYDEQGDTAEQARGNRLPKAWDCERGVGAHSSSSK